jgi:hypothetical protein
MATAQNGHSDRSGAVFSSSFAPANEPRRAVEKSLLDLSRSRNEFSTDLGNHVDWRLGGTGFVADAAEIQDQAENNGGYCSANEFQLKA